MLYFCVIFNLTLVCMPWIPLQVFLPHQALYIFYNTWSICNRFDIASVSIPVVVVPEYSSPDSTVIQHTRTRSMTVCKIFKSVRQVMKQSRQVRTKINIYLYNVAAACNFMFIWFSIAQVASSSSTNFNIIITSSFQWLLLNQSSVPATAVHITSFDYVVNKRILVVSPFCC